MFVWNIKHVEAISDLNLSVQGPNDYSVGESADYSIAIVGLGPKGLYSLAALQETLASSNTLPKVSLHLFNVHPCLAAGPNYDIYQPEYLLINYSIEKISAWKSSELYETEKLTFIDWIGKYSTSNKQPQKGDFASRALVGMYLRDALRIVLKSIPDEVDVQIYQAEVVACNPTENGKYRLELKGGISNEQVNYDKLMITTGHSFEPASMVDQENSGRLIKSVYPVEEKFKAIQSNHAVAIAGLGLTFVDTILALTEGRGGIFKTEKDQFYYEPSGLEPSAIYAFSRSGLPMVPRNGYEAEQYSISSEVRNLLNILKRKHGVIDFRSGLLPVIKLEMENAWYQAIISSKKVCKNWFTLFNFSRLINPFKDSKFTSNEEYQTAFSDLLSYYLDEMKKEPASSPLQQASAVWRHLLDRITEMYNFGGFSAASLEDFQKNFQGRFNQLSYGPPVLSMRKVFCLIQSGYLKLIRADKSDISAQADGSFSISTPEGTFMTVDFLIQASVAKNNFPSANSPIFMSFYKSGIAHPYGKDSRIFNWPALNEDGNLISQDGKVIKDITLYGTPTEGMTLDNDSLSRNKNNFASPWAASIETELNTIKSTMLS
jgi:hypothetical protein